MNKRWKIWFEVFNQAGEKVGAGVCPAEYKDKSNATRIAEELFGKEPDKYKFQVSVENPFIKEEEMISRIGGPTKSHYELAICDIGFKNTDFAVVVKKEDKERAEAEMALAYDCWSSEDAEACILPGYDENTIGQACYGDFIIEWLRERGIPCNEDIGFVELSTYCHDEPPADCEESDWDWRDARITNYWFEKTQLAEYLKTLDTTVEEYLKCYTYDDVDCDILQEVPYAFKLTVID